MALNNSFRVLVIGYGSIGQRHARLLLDIGCCVAVVSRRQIEFEPHYSELATALADWQPDYIVVANCTHEHYESIDLLAKQGFQGRVLVEKPLFDRCLPLPAHSFELFGVAYNMRYHLLIQRLKQFLAKQMDLVAVNIHVGQYLPQWRPGSNYRQSYSAYRNQGGGVLRDLSHEIDYALWLFGPWQRLTALGGHFSSLEIDSDDVYSLLLETTHCPLVSIHLDYLNRIPRRQVLVHTHKNTVSMDLIKGTFTVDNVSDRVSIAPDYSYLAEHQAILAGDLTHLCSPEQAAETMFTIEAVERAAATRSWIER